MNRDRPKKKKKKAAYDNPTRGDKWAQPQALGQQKQASTKTVTVLIGIFSQRIYRVATWYAWCAEWAIPSIKYI
jgi:hypothetical protein